MSQLVHLLEFVIRWEGVPALVLWGLYLAGSPRRPSFGLAALLAWMLLALEGGGGATLVLAAALGAAVAGRLRSRPGPASLVVGLVAVAWAWWCGGRSDLGLPAVVQLGMQPGLGYALGTACAIELVRRRGWLAAGAIGLALAVALSLEGRVRIAEASGCLALVAGALVAPLLSGPAVRWGLAVLGLAVAASATGDRGAGEYTHPADVPLERTLSATVDHAGQGLVSGLAVAPDGGVYFGEFTSGRIFHLHPGGRARTVATWAPAQPVAYRAESWEAGLWGLAVDPSGRWLYAMAAVEFGVAPPHGPPAAQAAIQRWPISEGSLGPPERILDGLPAAAVHSGGALAFDREGHLYVTVGDGGAAAHGDPRAGTILRLGADGSVPPDNPVAGSPVFATGARNPYGLAFLPSGDLLVTENGPNCCDRLLVVGPAADLGWPRYGTHPQDARAMVDDPAVTAPLWDSGTSRISPTGVVARGADTLWFATWHTAAVHEVVLDGDEVQRHRIVLDARAVRTPSTSGYAFPGGFSALAQAPDGTVWWAGVGGVGRLVAR